MKKTFTSLAAVILCIFTANAQKWFIGGSIGAAYFKAEYATYDLSESITAISVMPSINYMITDKWATGLGLGYNMINLFEEEKIQMFSFAPTAIYYVKLSEKFYYTPQFQIGFGFGRYKQQWHIAYRATFYEKENISSLSVALSPLSFEFRPTSCVGVNFACGDFSYRRIEIAETKYSIFKFKLNSTATVGFRYYF